MDKKAKLGHFAFALLLGAVIFGQSPLHGEERKAEIEVGTPSPPGIPALPSTELEMPAVKEAKTSEGDTKKGKRETLLPRGAG